jgi:SAM-dependent methyltransferase
VARATRWATDTGAGHSRWLINHFRRLAADGADLAGEARFLDVLVPRKSAILDAGCGTGRVGAALAERGHTVVGVDADPELIAAAHEDHPGPDWIVGDLTELDAALAGRPPFDAMILAGNVMPFLAAGTEVEVLRQLGRRAVPDAPIAVGFSLDRDYHLADFDRHIQEAGLVLEQRFATWDLRPWSPSSDYAVTVLRTPPA